MNSVELRQKFLIFFEKNGHAIVPSSSLLPTDSSVLFTTAGMQQFKPYYLGEKSPWGKSVASCQKCIRTSDIEEVGDERHLTFFEMLGNFSFGGPALNEVEGYFKEKAIELAYKFVAEELKLDIDYVTVFSPEKVPDGDWRKGVAEDTESYKIWKKYVPESKIRKEGVDNFWGPTGEEGPCGPTTEIYVNGIEIWNIVFNEFFCTKEKKLEKLETPGVDTGMGLERLAMVAQKVPTVFETDLFEPIMKLIPKEFDERKKRIIADHLRSVVFLAADGIIPGKEERSYIPRLLIRNAMTAYYINKKEFSKDFFIKLVDTVIDLYKKEYVYLDEKKSEIKEIIDLEIEKSTDVILGTIKDLRKIYNKFISGIDPEKKIIGLIIKDNLIDIDGRVLFKIRETHSVGLPIMRMIMESWGLKFTDRTLRQYEDAYQEARQLSRTASAGMFKGGLADHNSKTIKLHTAHHLLLAALQKMFGKQVKQRGSNINQERLRIDFSFDRKLTEEEKKKIEEMVNQKIKEGLEVVRKEMPKEEAEKIGAEMEFGVKYGNIVSVYVIGDKEGNIFSKEFCGGPHAASTDELGKFKITKEEAVSAGVRRIRATLQD